jgi:hypothetical protein
MAPSPGPHDRKMREASARAGRRETVPDINAQQDFSLVLGGPLFQLLRRVHLSGNALELLRQRILVLLSIIWS